MWEDNECDKYTVNNQLQQYPKEDAHIRDIEDMLILYGTILMAIKFNNFGGTRH